jgi:hypothetical protein
MMLDGIDWAEDREWERTIYGRTSQQHAFMLSTLRYPRFRQPPAKIPDGLTDEDLSDG